MSEPGDETVTVVNLITMPPEVVDGFVAQWSASTAALGEAPGFRGTRLLRTIYDDAEYQVVNVAEWDSVEQWRAALAAVQPAEDQRRAAEAAGIRPRHSFYRVAAVVPDPQSPATGV